VEKRGRIPRHSGGQKNRKEFAQSKRPRAADDALMTEKQTSHLRKKRSRVIKKAEKEGEHLVGVEGLHLRPRKNSQDSCGSEEKRGGGSHSAEKRGAYFRNGKKEFSLRRIGQRKGGK